MTVGDVTHDRWACDLSVSDVHGEKQDHSMRPQWGGEGQDSNLIDWIDKPDVATDGASNPGPFSEMFKGAVLVIHLGFMTNQCESCFASHGFLEGDNADKRVEPPNVGSSHVGPNESPNGHNASDISFRRVREDKFPLSEVFGTNVDSGHCN